MWSWSWAAFEPGCLRGAVDRIELAALRRSAAAAFRRAVFLDHRRRRCRRPRHCPRDRRSNRGSSPAPSFWSPQEAITSPAGIELDDRRRRRRGFLLFVGDVAAVDDIDVVASASMQTPPRRPVIQSPGRSFGQFASTSKCGTVLGRPGRRRFRKRRQSPQRLRRGGASSWFASLFEFLAAEIDGIERAHVEDVVERVLVSTSRSAALPSVSVP